MNLYFNELSLGIGDNRYVINAWLHQLGLAYKAALQQGFREIKVPERFLSHQFTKNYLFFQWADDPDFDPDLRSLLKSVITTTPAIEAMLAESQEEKGTAFECSYGGQPALGLGAASSFMFDSIAISLSTSVVWNTHEVGVSVTLFDDALNETVTEIPVRHLSEATHLTLHRDWLNTVLRPAINNGSILWLKKQSLFPHLIFCDQVRMQLSMYSGPQPEFIQIQKRLYELNEYAAGRPKGVFNKDLLPSKVTPESETRKRDFANELTHTCPDGQVRLFDWHVRFTPGAGRIHFYPLEDSNKIIVGSIANQNTVK